MATPKSFPSAITILMGVIVLAAVATWLLPAGQYNQLVADESNAFVITTATGEVPLPFTQQTLDSLGISVPLEKFSNGDIRRAISVPGTYHSQPQNPQGLLAIMQAPIKGIIDTIDIVLFILIIGGFMYIFNATGAMVKGITALAYTMRGQESRLIVVLTLVFSTLGASYGMDAESLVFYPLLVPLFLAAGYDLLVPLAVIFGGTTLGGIAAFSNPFSTIIASNAAGINWMDGLYQRLFFFAIINGVLITYILRYAAKVRKDPAASLVAQIDGAVKPPYDITIDSLATPPPLDLKTKLLLTIYVLTFVTMVAGVVLLDWWTLEMSTLFLGSSLLLGVITRLGEKAFVEEFIKGAASLLSVAFVVGIARGVTIVLNEGHVTDSVLFYTASLMEGVSPVFFILLVLVFFLVFTLFISSTSGMAVLTMTIMGSLAIIINIPGREIVNAYLYGMGLMLFVAPTGLILPALAMVNVSMKVWLRFITPLLLVLFVLCGLALVIGIYW